MTVLNQAIDGFCEGLSDREIDLVVRHISAVTEHMEMQAWRIDLIRDSPGVFRQYGGFTVRQRRALRGIIADAAIELVERGHYDNALAQLRHWAVTELPESTRHLALKTKELFVKRLDKQSWVEVPLDRLAAIDAILEGAPAGSGVQLAQRVLKMFEFRRRGTGGHLDNTACRVLLDDIEREMARASGTKDG